jgi:hypothetical protein
MTNQDLLLRIVTCVGFTFLLVTNWSIVSWAQTPAREGNEYDFRDWQPTRGEVRQEERAAGINQTPAQRKTEDHELQNLYKDLLRQDQPSPLAPPGNSR